MNKLFLFLTIFSITVRRLRQQQRDGRRAKVQDPARDAPLRQGAQHRPPRRASGFGQSIRLLAYDQALADGTDILELDVHETNDGTCWS